MMNRDSKGKLGQALLIVCIAVTCVFLLIFLADVLFRGASVLSWEFLFSKPRNEMTEGGVFPAIFGTFLLTLASIVIATPLAILSATYLTYYAKEGVFKRTVQIALDTLAGVPSIVYGLFGLTIFVKMLSMGVSLLAGACTLAVLVLPVIVSNAHEAFNKVPQDFIEASYGLGANKMQTILKVSLPVALPNILTGVIISIGRVAGETAPIMFTAVTFYSRFLPTGLLSEVMALPYHIYALVSEGVHPESQIPIAYGSAFILIILVVGVSSLAVVMRYRIRKNR